MKAPIKQLFPKGLSVQQDLISFRSRACFHLDLSVAQDPIKIESSSVLVHLVRGFQFCYCLLYLLKVSIWNWGLSKATGKVTLYTFQRQLNSSFAFTGNFCPPRYDPSLFYSLSSLGLGSATRSNYNIEFKSFWFTWLEFFQFCYSNSLLLFVQSFSNYIGFSKSRDKVALQTF